MSDGSRDAWVYATTPLTVIYRTGDKPVPALKSAAYTPTVNDHVAVLKHASTLLIICKVG